MNGNYKLIDLKNIEIRSGSTGATIEGIYNAIDKATMPVKVINVNKNGTKLVTNFGQGVRKSSGNYYVDLGDGTELKVTDADKVTYANKPTPSADVETGFITVTITDGTAVLNTEHAKTLNALDIIIVESDVTLVNHYISELVVTGTSVLVPIETENVLTALYEVKYLGPIAGAIATKITLS